MLNNTSVKIALACCNAVAVLALFLVLAIFIPTFDMEFYRAEYAKSNASRRIGVEEGQLMAVTERLTDYMRGRADDLVIVVEVNGVEREFFSDIEKAHMVDVKGLFTIARAARVISLCVIAVTWVLLRRDQALAARAGLYTVLGFIAAALTLVALISLDFNSAFTTFHHIFFNNDLWILDPSKDLLINIVPLDFFISISTRVALIFGAFTLGYAALLFVRLRKWR